MLLDAAVLAIILGLIGGGRFGQLRELDLRAPWAFVLAALVQVGLMVLGARGSALAAALGGPLHIVTFVLLLLGLWLNRHLWGVRVAGVGVLLNCVVIAANGGSMPVDRALAVRAGNTRLVEALDSPTYVNHTPATAQTRLRPLADVLPLPLLVPRPRFFSPGSVGDVFVTAGVCWLILGGMGAFGLGGKASEASGESDVAEEKSP